MANISFAIGTRCHAQDTSDPLEDLHSFLKAASKISTCVLVAVDNNLLAERINAFDYAGVIAFVVSPWGYAAALNALCLKSVTEGYKQILFASVAFSQELGSATELTTYLLEDVVMVGAATEEHDYIANTLVREATARQMPWNTFALVNAEKLICTGVPLLSDNPALKEGRGMEEAVTLALQSYLGNRAVLAKITGIGRWPKKSTNHDEKMKSKNPRAQEQLRILRLDPPTVRHV